MWLVVAAVLAVPVLELQPPTVRPGDAVLIRVGGVEEVSGVFEGHELSFVPCPEGLCALVGISVEHAPGAAEVRIDLGADADPRFISGAVDIAAAQFPHRTLKVSPRFTSVSKKDQLRSARDQKAFVEAFDRDFEPLKLRQNFTWPRPNDVTAPFGDLRMFNGKKQSQHFGVDLEGETGDPIYAAADGEVVMVRDCFASGNTVLVHHGARLFTAYFHLSKFEVEPGAHVSRGQRLGLVGKTGRVTGPHLHWGAKIDGRWVDPISVLALRFVR